MTQDKAQRWRLAAVAGPGGGPAAQGRRMPGDLPAADAMVIMVSLLRPADKTEGSADLDVVFTPVLRILT